jgi:hypothetical protein
MNLRNLWLAALIGAAAVVAHSQSADHNPGLALQGPDQFADHPTLVAVPPSVPRSRTFPSHGGRLWVGSSRLR